jgi:medium-chain acyl-[acyl-carrier-protein] hydrolase
MTQQTSKWVVPLTPTHLGQHKLFCFPYAGSGASVYRNWGKLLQKNIQGFAIQPPGRETRFSEDLLASIDDYATQAQQAIEPYCSYNEKLILFGHSLGALAAYETAKRLQSADAHVDLLIVSGRQDPTRPSIRPPISHLNNVEFIQQMATYNGTPAAILQNEELLELLLPMIRADFSMSEHYTRCPITTQLACPVIALSSRQDEWLSKTAIDDWKNISSGSFETHWFEGDHFYLNQSAKELVAFLSDKILNLQD